MGAVTLPCLAAMALRMGSVSVWSPPIVSGTQPRAPPSTRSLYHSVMISTLFSRWKVLIGTSPQSATCSDSKGAARVAML